MQNLQRVSILPRLYHGVAAQVAGCCRVGILRTHIVLFSGLKCLLQPHPTPTIRIHRFIHA